MTADRSHPEDAGKMTIDAGAPVVLAAEESVAATPEVVWEILSDVANWPNWHPGIRSVTTDGPPEVGRRFVWKPGRATTLTSIMGEVEPGERIGWTGQHDRLDRTACLELQSRGQPVEDLYRGVDGRLVAWLFRRQLQKSVQRDLETWLASLKAAAEDRAST